MKTKNILGAITITGALFFTACDGVNITNPTPSCTENDKQDYNTFIEASRQFEIAFGDLRDAAFNSEDWPASADELNTVKNDCENARVVLEDFCQEIQDALINTINDNPSLQLMMTNAEIVNHFGIAIQNQVDVDAFKTGALNGEVKIGDTVVVYLGEEHLPFSKSGKIDQYNEVIIEILGGDYKLPKRNSLHYCAIDAFPVLIANQMQKAQAGNIESMAFLQKIDPLMLDFKTYINAVPTTIN
ncbi:MAG: hypothetical protein KDC92_00640 [Bacteroidetes bacterium]|nr:hypothetical protein [Bacteroidota bacterium]